MSQDKSIEKSIIMDFLKAGYNLTPDALSFIKKKYDEGAKSTRLLLSSIPNKTKTVTITKAALEDIAKALEKTSNYVRTERKTRSAGEDSSPPETSAIAVPAVKKAIKPQIGTNPAPAPANQLEAESPEPSPGVVVSAVFQAVVPSEVEPQAVQMNDEVMASAARASSPSTSKSTFTANAKEYHQDVKILQDCTSHLKNDGEFTDFMHLFDDRFEKIKKIFKSRKEFAHLTDIADLETASRKGQDLFVIGMVTEKHATHAGNIMLMIEDKTGSISVFLSSKSIDQKLVGQIVHDEVLGFKGTCKDDRFIATEFYYPDVRRSHKPTLSEEDLSICLISDLHLGSDNHLADLWDRFKKWMRGENLSDKSKEIVGKIKYVSIAGDIIDGVGVYPSQEQHLVIKDVFQQFDRAAEELQDLPDYLTFIICPGSHEPVRRALPQPAIPKSYAPKLHAMGVIMVGDPAMVETNGVKTMLFHGESFIDLSMDIPGITNATPQLSMKKLLTSRHLAPAYGKKTELAPDRHDWLVIEDIPDILHTGHVHCNGVEMYHGTWMVNSGCFQGQTDYMKSLGIVPTPGQPNVVNLKTFDLTSINLEQ
jgi:DNA polymerase II small subunit